jgi:hypothetical protein
VRILISGLWAFLRGLFRRPRPSAPPLASVDPQESPPVAPPTSPEPEPEPAPPEPIAQSPQPTDEPALQASNDDWDEDEDWGGDEEDGVEDDEEPDPFISGMPPPDNLASEDVERLRAQARTEAVQGEHHIYLSSPAGPGSLAEALNLLLGEGLVEAHFVDEAGEDPYILYRPVG